MCIKTVKTEYYSCTKGEILLIYNIEILLCYFKISYRSYWYFLFVVQTLCVGGFGNIFSVYYFLKYFWHLQHNKESKLSKCVINTLYARVWIKEMRYGYVLYKLNLVFTACGSIKYYLILILKVTYRHYDFIV